LIKGSKDSDSSLVCYENLSEILWSSGWACCDRKAQTASTKASHCGSKQQ